MANTWTARGVGCSNRRTDPQSPGQNVYMGISNNSDAELVVRNIYVEMLQPDVGDMPAQGVYRLDALMGGESLAVAKSDTGNASLPSQVKVVKNPDDYTLGDLFSEPGQLRGTRTGWTDQQVIFGARLRADKSSSYLNMRGRPSGSPVEPIVLREGEGLAWAQTVAGTPKQQWGMAIIRNQSSGATYYATVRDVPSKALQCMIAVFNGSGSGVVLEVDLVEALDAGHQGDGTTTYPEQSSAYPGIRLVLGSSIEDGEDVTPYAHDTNNTLPSGITATKNGIIRTADHAITAWPMRGQPPDTADMAYHTLGSMQRVGLFRGFTVKPTESWGVASTIPTLRFSGSTRKLYDSPGGPIDGATSGIVVRRGECLALCHWYQCIDWASLSGTVLSKADTVLTMAIMNVTFEFTVGVGQGTKIALAGPNAQTIVG